MDELNVIDKDTYKIRLQKNVNQDVESLKEECQDNS